HINKTTRVALRQAHQLIQQHGINLLGTVVNAVQHAGPGKSGYGYSRGYSEYLQTSQPALRPSRPQPQGTPVSLAEVSGTP
ncbi:MAG TPA: hypothetical protein VK137_14765, partial [Planctomycetaceae bacterium]|nr:hypothetical protein [Planctomycetaceae bacterium]